LEHREEDGREVTSPQRVAEARARIAGRLVGRERELDLVLAAVAVGRDMLLEGPPGTPKSTLRPGPQRSAPAPQSRCGLALGSGDRDAWNRIAALPQAP
jgi:hypothetical protein